MGDLHWIFGACLMFELNWDEVFVERLWMVSF